MGGVFSAGLSNNALSRFQTRVRRFIRSKMTQYLELIQRLLLAPPPPPLTCLLTAHHDDVSQHLRILSQLCIMETTCLFFYIGSLAENISSYTTGNVCVSVPHSVFPNWVRPGAHWGIIVRRESRTGSKGHHATGAFLEFGIVSCFLSPLWISPLPFLHYFC